MRESEGRGKKSSKTESKNMSLKRPITPEEAEKVIK